MDLSFQPGLGLQRHFPSGSQSCCFTDPGEGNLTVRVFPVCLAKKYWTPKMRLKARLWLTQTVLAGLSLSGNRGRVSPVTSGVAARSKNGRSIIPTPHGDAYTTANPTTCPSRCPLSLSHVPTLVESIPQNPGLYVTSRSSAPAPSWKHVSSLSCKTSEPIKSNRRKGQAERRVTRLYPGCRGDQRK